MSMVGEEVISDIADGYAVDGDKKVSGPLFEAEGEVKDILDCG